MTLFSLLSFASPSALADGPTVALVVGNERYANERLPGAADAAERLAARLDALGVEVTLVGNATRAPFERAGREFAARAAGARLAIVAYAGHALRLGGSAYLVPTDVDLRSRSDLKRLPDLQKLIDMAARAERSLVVLDTCHASNFAAGWGERRYDKAPLCPGEDEGFERPSGTVLAWASDVPTPRGRADGTGRLLEALAGRLESPSSDLPGALRAVVAASGATLVGGEGSWPLLEAGTAVADAGGDGDAERRGDDPGESAGGELVSAAPLPSGRYRVSNLYRSRRLGVDGRGEVALVGNDGAGVADVWTLRTNDDGSVALAVAAGTLVPDGDGVALGEGRSRWRVVPIEGGLPNEFGVRSADEEAWLVGDVGSARVTLDDTPGGTGWLLERVEGAGPPVEPSPPALPPVELPPIASPDPGPTGEPAEGTSPDVARRVRLTVRPVPEDARVRITNITPRYVPGIELWPNETYVIEVRHPAFGRVERRVTLGDEDLVLPIVMADEDPLSPPVISGEDRATVAARLEAVQTAVEARDLARLARLVPPGERLDRLVGLMDTYSEIDVEIRDLLGSDDGRRLSAVLRIVRLVDAFGDTVVPPPAFRDTALYAEREGGSGWSGLRWDTGSG